MPARVALVLAVLLAAVAGPPAAPAGAAAPCGTPAARDVAVVVCGAPHARLSVAGRAAARRAGRPVVPGGPLPAGRTLRVRIPRTVSGADLVVVFRHPSGREVVTFRGVRLVRGRTVLVRSARTRAGRLVVRLHAGARVVRPSARTAPVASVADPGAAPPAPAPARAGASGAAAGARPAAPAPSAPAPAPAPASDPVAVAAAGGAGRVRAVPTGGGGCAVPDATLDARWTRSGGGWTGGDGSYSVPLPDGRVAWLFGDTFLGTVHADRSRPAGSPMVRNALVVEDGAGALRTLPGTGRELLAAPAEGEWYWPGHGTVEGDRLRVLVYRFGTTGDGGDWGFAYRRTEVATLSLPGLEVLDVRPVDASGPVMWGVWVVEDGQHTYVYGVEDRGLDKFVHVARTARDDLAGAWRFWDGAGWSEDPAASARVASGVSNQFSVVRRGARWTLVTQAGTFGREISVRSASGPAGPWGAPRTVYTTPQWGGRSYTYNATAHPELATGDELVIGYNVNSLDGAELVGDADLYRPRFVRVPAACADGQ